MYSLSLIHIYGSHLLAHLIGLLQRNMTCDLSHAVYAARKHCANPVSYTHLDVYKRQEDTVLTSTPFWSAIVAKVWRRSWNRIRGSPARFSTLCSRCV